MSCQSTLHAAAAAPDAQNMEREGVICCCSGSWWATMPAKVTPQVNQQQMLMHAAVCASAICCPTSVCRGRGSHGAMDGTEAIEARLGLKSNGFEDERPSIAIAALDASAECGF